MTGKKFFTKEDVIQIKSRLGNLPDLKTATLTKSEVLSELTAQIIALYSDKGYTVEGIRSALEAAGLSVGLKAIIEIVPQKKFTLKRSASARKNIDADKG